MKFPSKCGGAIALAILALQATAAPAQDGPRHAGTERGYLLPNGWTVSPVGAQVALADLPLNIIPTPDGRHALVATSGYNEHELSLVDLAAATVVAKQTVAESWFGLALDRRSGSVWWSGGGGKVLHRFTLDGPRLTRPAGDMKVPHRFQSGMALDPSGKTLFTLDINAGSIVALDVGGGSPPRSARAGTRPYDVAPARNGSRLYVSDWAGRAVLALDPTDLRVVATIAIGEHPNQIAVHPADDRLFVACASSNSVAVIDSRRGIVTETIATTLFPRAPEGSTPDALAVAPDGKTLYVANADNNCVVVVDVASPGRSQVKGFIPTGWYPTAVAVTPDGKTLLVGVGKGNRTRANPIAREELAKAGDSAVARLGLPYRFVGSTLSGALSAVPIPDEKTLAGYTATVYRNCPYSDRLLTDAPYPEKTAIPTKVGEPSPIKYVIYIIKENRTYDQVFGDMPKGNGDPSLVMFGRDVTPNHHKLAEEFVLLDNLYCNGHVSADGHPWSTAAYNTDYVARSWALGYSDRTGVLDDAEGSLKNPPSGYLWDACARANLTYRSYGEYGRRVSRPDGTEAMEGAVPGLVGHVCPDYQLLPGKRYLPRDTQNAETFLREFRRFVSEGSLPRFIVMSLGEDHTTGTNPGTNTPQACVASNDLALGRIVDAVTHSKVWPETAIFVIEDDAQNGPDHVDAHRTVGLVISPYTKRHHLDSTQYSTVSMIRTIELILGLAPLSQYDAAARPMFASFAAKPDTTPYVHEAARIDLNARNAATAYGAGRSSRMDFSDYDRVDDFELDEILWRAVKGADAPLPPAVRRAIAYRR
jgi:YVTN family beta-propeller protein